MVVVVVVVVVLNVVFEGAAGLVVVVVVAVQDNGPGIAADNVAVESLAADIGNQDYPLPFHCLALTEMGMPLGELWNFEELARDCANDGRYVFLLCAPPLSIPGAFGSPVNPIAVK